MESKSTELFIGKREVSFYDAPIFNTTPKASLNLNQIYDLIKGDSYKRITEAVRGSSSKEIIKEIKSHRLDYVTFGGVFEKRANTSLQKASGYMAIDLDDLSEVEKVKQILLNDQMLDTVMLFTSPSGKGLKWIIHHDPRYEMEYGEYFDAVRNYLSDKYAIEVDKSGRDIARACFLCSDPDAIYHHLRSARCFNILNPNDWLKHSITINDQKKHSETFKEASGSDLKRKEALGSDFEAFESEHKVIESDELISQVEFVITQIEEKKVDLTENYDDWVKIGFGLARSLRERGRDYFHKISQYYPNYNASECNLKYDDCLKSKDQGVTIATFFSLAGLAGLEVFEESEEFHDGHHDAHNVGNDAHRAQNMNSLNGIERHRQEYDGIDRILPEIPDHVYNKLPKVLHGLCELFEKSEEKDLILLGSIATTSSVLPHVFGKYDTKTVYPNINLFITAPASAGKGVLSFCKRLVVPIHNQMREESKLQQVDYERQMNIYNITKKDNPDAEKPVKPPEKLLFIPANSSSTGVFQLLADNNGRGLIFETEGDTLSNTFKSEYGNYSDGFRKAFHHETISYYRRTERELVEIKEPMLSTVLSGTPGQIQNLIKNVEDGLFSRFMFYSLELKLEWKDVFRDNSGYDFEEFFDLYAMDIKGIYDLLMPKEKIEFKVTKEQGKKFNKLFDEWQDKYFDRQGEQIIASVRRCGVIAFRIAMILSTLRIIDDGVVPDAHQGITCGDDDFNNAIDITNVLLEHTEKVFCQLPKKTVNNTQKREITFLNALPTEFNRKKYVEIAGQSRIPDNTAQKYIRKFVKEGVIKKKGHDSYEKLKP